MSEAAYRSLEELQASILFASDFPRRTTYTRSQYVELLKARSANMLRTGRSDPCAFMEELRSEACVGLGRTRALQDRNAGGDGRTPIVDRGS
jgi:hypothetical protein